MTEGSVQLAEDLPPAVIETPRMKVEATIDEVCGRRRVKRWELDGERRVHRYVIARHEIMYLLRINFGFSLPRIGRCLNRDHTTVLNGIMKHCLRERLPFPADLNINPARSKRVAHAIAKAEALAVSSSERDQHAPKRRRGRGRRQADARD